MREALLRKSLHVIIVCNVRVRTYRTYVHTYVTYIRTRKELLLRNLTIFLYCSRLT